MSNGGVFDVPGEKDTRRKSAKRRKRYGLLRERLAAKSNAAIGLRSSPKVVPARGVEP